VSLIGQRFGAYHVQALLGVGAMGEVYRAHDTRLGRDVALKVLPPDVTADRDRLARFEREARTLASLNHPHIGAIYGLEDGIGDTGRGIQALVLELVEGETLAERLARAGSAAPSAICRPRRMGRSCTSRGAMTSAMFGSWTSSRSVYAACTLQRSKEKLMACSTLYCGSMPSEMIPDSLSWSISRCTSTGFACPSAT